MQYKHFKEAWTDCIEIAYVHPPLPSPVLFSPIVFQERGRLHKGYNWTYNYRKTYTVTIKADQKER